MEFRNAVGHLDPPGGMVDEPVVAAAEQDAVQDPLLDISDDTQVAGRCFCQPLD
jgi:hypothetical protein